MVKNITRLLSLLVVHTHDARHRETVYSVVTAPVAPLESSPPHVLPERRSKNVTAAPKYRKAATVRCIS